MIGRGGFFASAMSFTLLASHAPMQCTRSADPDTRLEDQPGDALWALAAKFRGEGNVASADATLSYLVAKYPSDRHAPAAREMLAGHAESADVGAHPESGDGGAR